MVRVLPLTLPEMLEQELEHAHGDKELQHDWEFASGEVDDKLVMDRLRENPLVIAYFHIFIKLGAATADFGREFNKWNDQGLLHRDVLRSSMITRAHEDMYDQVARLKKNADPQEIRRVNRTILETLFPDAIQPAEKRHLQATVERLHRHQLSAVCLSGGGIRSATFGLGVLQGLARAGDKKTERFPIQDVDYLSTVSGGGYIGGWLTAWIKNAGGKASAVFAELRKGEPDQVRWLREYSNYLTPRFSLFSVDTATLVATWLRNVVINWLMFLPFLIVLMLLPRLLASVVTHYRAATTGWFVVATALPILAVMLIALAEPKLETQNRPGRAWLIRITHVAIFASGLLVPLFWSGLPFGNIGLVAFLLFGAGVHVIGTSIAILYTLFTMVLTSFWRVLQDLEFTTDHRAKTLIGKFFKYLPSSRPLMKMFFAAICGGIAGGFVLRVLTWWSALRPPITMPELYTLLAPPAFLLAFLLAATVFTAVSSRWTTDEVHEYWTRIGASTLIGAFAYIVICAISFYGPWVLSLAPEWFAALGGITGVIGVLVGRSGLSPAGDKEDRGRTVSDHVTAFVIPIFILILLASIAGGISALLAFCWPGEFPAAGSLVDSHLKIVRTTAVGHVLIFGGAVIGLALAASLFIDVNKFSMHALYRMRLVRAYLGASRSERNFDPFTGFDSKDSPLLVELRQIEKSHIHLPNPPFRVQKPFHVVNMALNLVRGRQLAWQQRKASTFTASPLHWGNWGLGYRDAEDYGKENSGLALGTAITISGAAASPNMGYHSSPPLSFLLALFNVRLGAWLGNPGVAGGRSRVHDVIVPGPAWKRGTPKSSIMHQLAEAFGATDDQHQYVYLSDGGHFENLGLYEMVMRRCHYVIVSDAGADHELKFEDLGNAVRKIRIDFGIPIEFSRFTMFARDEKKLGAHCAIGRIRYSAADGRVQDGHLLYIKASYYASGPQDVRQYARKVRRFPHESTADQFFTESQFESYRRLGEWVIDTIMGGETPGTMRELFAAAREYEQKHAEETRW